MALPHVIGELRRRRVFHTLVAYGVVAFAIIQVAEPIIHGLRLPDWTLSFVVVLLAIGFPVTVLLAWTFDLTSRGLERTTTAPQAPASEEANAASRSPERRPMWLLVALGIAAAAPGLAWVVWREARAPSAPAEEPARPSIAVLPFADLSPRHDQEHFSDGLADEILNVLAHVEGLRVVGRTSSFSFKGKGEDLRSIAQKLNVGAVLEGSVRTSGSRVRVTAQLIDAKDGYHLWSGTFDRELEDIFAVQDEIARAVVGALEVKLAPSGAPPTVQQRATSIEAYNYYLRGRQHYYRANYDDSRLAIEALERAIAIDPSYAPAWAALAIPLFDVADRAPTLAESLALRRRSLEVAERAVALAPDLADGYSARGTQRSLLNHDWAGARADLERAIALNPGDPHARRRLGVLVANTKDVREGIAILLEAMRLDPLSPQTWFHLARLYTATGEFDLARDAVERGARIAPDSPSASGRKLLIELEAGRVPAAKEALQTLKTEQWRLVGTALVEQALGNDRDADVALHTLVERFAHVRAFSIAVIYASRGDRDHAIEWLDRACEQRNGGIEAIRVEPRLRPLHGDPRFTALLRKMNLPDP